MNRLYYFLILTFNLSILPAHINAQIFSPSTNKNQKVKNNSKEIERLVLITGCARSGTSFVAKALTNCGLHLNHESSYGNHGIVSWFMAVDTQLLPYGVKLEPCRFQHIFLQVRDPLKTIASLGTEPLESWGYVQRFLPQIRLSDPKIVKGAKYWYYWNLLAEKKAEWIYRIEDIDFVIDEMSERLGIELDKSGLNTVSRNSNTRGYIEPYTWQDLQRALDPELYLNIVKMASRYGYSISTTPSFQPNNFSITIH